MPAMHANGQPSIDDITVTVMPPQYAGLRDTTIRNPARIVALTGSRVRVTAHANASRVIMETATRRDTLTRASGNDFNAKLLYEA